MQNDWRSLAYVTRERLNIDILIQHMHGCIIYNKSIYKVDVHFFIAENHKMFIDASVST